MAEPLLQTRDLSMHFGGAPRRAQCRLHLEEGELRCLIGPNGAGKSTFFKMLTGQLQPTHGQVLFRAGTFPARMLTKSRGSASASRPRFRTCSTAFRYEKNIWLSAKPAASWREGRGAGRRDDGAHGADCTGGPYGRPARARPAAMGRTRACAVDRSGLDPSR